MNWKAPTRSSWVSINGWMISSRTFCKAVIFPWTEQNALVGSTAGRPPQYFLEISRLTCGGLLSSFLIPGFDLSLQARRMRRRRMFLITLQSPFVKHKSWHSRLQAGLVNNPCRPHYGLFRACFEAQDSDDSF